MRTIHTMMTMILTATALVGVTLPMSPAMACGSYGDLVEAPRPEIEQSWTCRGKARADKDGVKVVDILRLDTTGGKDTMWGFLWQPVLAEGAQDATLGGRPNDFGLATWNPRQLRIQMYGRSVTLTPAPWSPDVLYATLRHEAGTPPATTNFVCTPTP